jgi:hypothetical protein
MRASHYLLFRITERAARRRGVVSGVRISLRKQTNDDVQHAVYGKAERIDPTPVRGRIQRRGDSERQRITDRGDLTGQAPAAAQRDSKPARRRWRFSAWPRTLAVAARQRWRPVFYSQRARSCRCRLGLGSMLDQVEQFVGPLGDHAHFADQECASLPA